MLLLAGAECRDAAGRAAGANIDFDYADEEIFSRHGKVRKEGDGPALFVGKARYRTVLVPPMATIRRSTLGLLDRFAAEP